MAKVAVPCICCLAQGRCLYKGLVGLFQCFVEIDVLCDCFFEVGEKLVVPLGVDEKCDEFMLFLRKVVVFEEVSDGFDGGFLCG